MKKAIKMFFSVDGNKAKVVLFLILSLIYNWVDIRKINLVQYIFHAAKDNDMYRIVAWSVITVIALVSMIITAYILGRIQSGLQYKMNAKCTDAFANKMLYMDYDQFTNIGQGHAFTVLGKTNAVGQITFDMVHIIGLIPAFIISITSLYALSLTLGFTVSCIVICMMFAIYTLFRDLFKLSDKTNEVETEMNREFSEIISGFMEIRGNTTETFHRNKVRKLRHKMNSVVDLINKKDATIDSYCEFVQMLMTVTICGSTAIMIFHGKLSIDAAVAAIYYGWKLSYPVINSSATIARMVPSLANYKMYDEYMSVENTIKDGEKEICEITNGISFQDVSFSYKDVPTLNHVSVFLKKGQHIGICGQTGCGKSTFIKMIERLYDPGEGTIKIDGVDIRDYTLGSLRGMLGVVNQESHIFNGTILDNVVYGSVNPSKEEIASACERAQLGDLINELPDGIMTVVGENGLRLSGGERQRIALARVFLRDPQIIILDEATSALDNSTEAFIKEAVDSMKGKTVITIAHRLSTIRNCDQILVFDDGKIVESGTHEELLAKKESSIYSNLCKVSQMKCVLGGGE